MADMQIPIAFQRKFTDQFHLLGQQMDSRLWDTGRDPDELNGLYAYFDRLGATEGVEGLPRNADTPNIDVPHSRRQVGLVDWDWGKLVDHQDAVRMGRGDMAMAVKYATLAIGASNRQKDRKFIAALGGNAVSVDENLAATNVPLPAGQKIVHGGTGLTKSKLITAKKLLDKAELLPDVNGQPRKRYLACTAEQIEDLLNTTEVVSSDYNVVKALVSGEVNTWLGFEFRRLELLLTDATPSRLCYGYVAGVIGRAIGTERTSKISERPDKRHAIQAYVMMQINATRIEDEGVVEIACNE